VYKRILVGTDGSAAATAAVERAAELARATGATLHVVSAYQDPVVHAALAPEALPIEMDDWRAAVQAAVEAMLVDLSGRLSGGGLPAETHAVSGHPVPAILGVARRIDAQLLVVGNRGMRGPRRVLGSVPNSITHQAPCDVLVVHTT
jgi:nucleotide-binding universal stress UspA family protein